MKKRQGPLNRTRGIYNPGPGIIFTNVNKARPSKKIFSDDSVIQKEGAGVSDVNSQRYVSSLKYERSTEKCKK